MTATQSPAHNDFRSDTFTTITPSMMNAMTKATLGDSVYGEDETTSQFEQKIATLAGKESGLYVVSGTLSNQIGIRTHLYQPPYSILCDYRAHVYTSEAAGLAILSQAMVTPVIPSNGVYLTLEDIQNHVILGDDVHSAPTKLISLENTLGGTIMPIEEMKRISEWAWANGINMHLDGARLWNASAETGIGIEEYGKSFDSMSLCISKGLGAPVGSVLVGKKQFIKKAEWFRKQQGGGIRQAGPLAAAATVAVDEIWPTMKSTHKQAQRLANELTNMGCEFMAPVQTNFIFVDLKKSGLNLEAVEQACEKYNVKVWAPRVALHHQITDESVDNVIAAFKQAKEESKGVNGSKTLNRTGYNHM